VLHWVEGGGRIWRISQTHTLTPHGQHHCSELG
jgi:hypothetical protein